jgi:hypothetical protein
MCKKYSSYTISDEWDNKILCLQVLQYAGVSREETVYFYKVMLKRGIPAQKNCRSAYANLQ